MTGFPQGNAAGGNATSTAAHTARARSMVPPWSTRWSTGILVRFPETRQPGEKVQSALRVRRAAFFGQLDAGPLGVPLVPNGAPLRAVAGLVDDDRRGFEGFDGRRQRRLVGIPAAQFDRRAARVG